MKRTILCLCLLTVLSSDAVAEGWLSGTVTDRVSGLPVAGTRVTVHVLLPDSIAFPTETDSAGRYAITGIVPGNEIYVIMAGKPMYKGYYLRYDDLGSGSHTVDIVLEPQEILPPGGGEGDSSIVSGLVLARTGVDLAPLAGAEVTLRSGGRTLLAVTDLEGEYRSVVPQGSYAITASAPGYESSGSNGVEVGPEGTVFSTVLTPTVTHVTEEKRLQREFGLISAYPNPFNPSTRIRYAVAAAQGGDTRIRLTVHNLLGQELAVLVDGIRSPGTYEVAFDASGLPSGVYLCFLSTGTVHSTEKLIVAR